MTHKSLKHLYLVDGSGFIFRAFHALPPLTRPDGVQVNAVYGFINMLIKLLQDTDADHLAVIFDAARENFRHSIYPAYKAHRPPPPPELIPQFELIHQACEAFGITCFKQEGFEADDLIATYTRQALEEGAHVTIVSSDKDLMQLVRPGVDMRDPLKDRRIGASEVIEKFGVPPEKVRDVQALAGDATDNVPGIPGIGIKTAAQLIHEFGDLETLLQRAHEIPQTKRREVVQQHAEDARISYKLVSLEENVPIQHDIHTFSVPGLDENKLIPFLQAQNFNAIINRLIQNGKLEANTQVSHDRETQQRTYTLVQDEESLQQWVEKARHQGFVAIDTETDSLDSMAANLVGISLSVHPHEACYIPLRHHSKKGQDLFNFTPSTEQEDFGKQLPLPQVVKILKDLLVDPSVLKIGQNIKYDLHVLENHGLTVSPIDDTMILSYVLDGDQHGHGMDALAQRHLGVETIKFTDLVGKGKTAQTFDEVPLDKACEYAAEDADITLQLYQILKPSVIKAGVYGLHETVERPLIPVLTRMEHTGVRIDPHVLKSLSADFAKRMYVLEGHIHTLAKRKFNIGSPKQLGEILFDELKLEGGKKGKTGAYSTSSDVLEELAAQGHELPQKVQEWRQLSKLKSTYTDALVKDINPKTGRVHTSYAMTVTSTGRLSSSEPNLQNIPTRTADGREIRKAFVAAPGWKILSFDYSQIELRLLAHMADIKTLQEAFHHNVDIHAHTASEVFGIPLDKMDSATRSRAKAINFGIIYGISSFGLARQLGISKAQAKTYIDSYFERYPGIRQFMENMKAFAHDHGFVQTMFGRKCFAPNINSKNGALRAFAERQAINAPLQGTAAEIIKKAMIQVDKFLSDQKLHTKMILQVHDELVFEVPENEVSLMSDQVKKIMESVVSLKVPLIVDLGIGANWAEAH